MRSVFIVGDGPLDESILPNLIETLVKEEIESAFIAWKEIRTHSSGFGRKLSYIVRRAMADRREVVVAVVDRDKDRRNKRVGDLESARAKNRSQNIDLPTALGQAIPHGEAWLLDDVEAVRAGLELAAAIRIPRSDQVSNPKSTLTELHQQSPLAEISRREAWNRIAQKVQYNRCRVPRKTGFEPFRKDLQKEWPGQ